MATLKREQYERWNNQAQEIAGNGWRFDVEAYVFWTEKRPLRDTKLENGEILREKLVYFPEYERIVNQYGVRYNRETGRVVPLYIIERLYPLNSGCYRVIEEKRKEIGEAREKKDYAALLKLAANIERAA